MDSRTCAASVATSYPFTVIVPQSALSRVESTFTTVVLPVRLEEGEDGARRHVEVNAAQHSVVAVGLGESSDLDGW